MTIFLPFHDHFVNQPCYENVNMADKKNNEMNEKGENGLIKRFFFQGFEYKIFYGVFLSVMVYAIHTEIYAR